MARSLPSIVSDGGLFEMEKASVEDAYSLQELELALHAAIRTGLVSAILKLVRASASVESTAQRSGWRPLHLAVEHEQLEAIRVLVAAGADPSSKTHDGMTPLHLAVDVAEDSFGQMGFAGSLQAIKLLLDLGADPESKDDSGETPQDWAAASSIAEISRLFESEIRPAERNTES